MASASPSTAAAPRGLRLALAASALLLAASALVATGTTRAWLADAVVNEGNVVRYVEPAVAPLEEAPEPAEGAGGPDAPADDPADAAPLPADDAAQGEASDAGKSPPAPVGQGADPVPEDVEGEG
ncbi:hypothetical protein GS424_010010 [Eggerthella guodeyinii]|uniref:Uncharacterized protein n=1 Tax=Eggerthella guodeyinii TaxID=2690837 RepID=A0A6L7IS37_9ACTN|nr:hypothetical protein [Eggerthella guodeyinii]QOS66890.1 hypothetical protein GS424_010010 [Eggerthella guodeyinii]